MELEAGAELGEADTVTLIQPDQLLSAAAGDQGSLDSTQTVINRVTESKPTQRKQRLRELVGKPELLTPEQTEELHQFLGEHHEVFCL